MALRRVLGRDEHRPPGACREGVGDAAEESAGDRAPAALAADNESSVNLLSDVIDRLGADSVDSAIRAEALKARRAQPGGRSEAGARAQPAIACRRARDCRSRRLEATDVRQGRCLREHEGRALPAKRERPAPRRERNRQDRRAPPTCRPPCSPRLAGLRTTASRCPCDKKSRSSPAVVTGLRSDCSTSEAVTHSVPG